MNDITAEQLLAQIGLSSKNTKSAVDAEIYYNYNSNSGSCSSSSSYSRFQQSTELEAPAGENLLAPSAPISSSGASHPGMKKQPKNTGKTGEPKKNIPRKISTEHLYTKIIMSVNDIRIGKRTTRMTAYLSLKEEKDKKLTIFLRSSLTSSLDETFRLIRKQDNKALESVAQDMVEACSKDAKLLLGRIKYNPRRFKTEDEHRHNLKYGLLAVYDYGDRKEALLYLLDEYYPILLTDDTTQKQSMFDYTGSYTLDDTEFEGNEELE